ncbi:MAG: shikimate kinase AroK [Thermodesulfovibrionales bacterium]
MRNIVLTGFMGAGKTAVSRELARLTGFAQIDVDAEIEKSAGMTITEIFAKLGEPRFRDMETEEIKKAARRANAIVSTGGGAVMREENMAALRQGGVIVCLWASPETILRRTGGDKSRPLLQVADPLAKINELLALRRPYYEKADIVVETDDKSPLEVAEEILRRVRGGG